MECESFVHRVVFVSEHIEMSTFFANMCEKGDASFNLLFDIQGFLNALN